MNNFTTTSRIKLPDHLSKEAQKWARKIASEYILENHHIQILILAAECLDRISEARQQITKDGSFYLTKEGFPREHPALKTERENKALHARLLRELNLDTDSKPEFRAPRRF